MFSDSDKRQMASHQLQIETINYQLEKFKSGFPPTVLSAPAIKGNGILHLSEQEVADMQANYENNLNDATIVKFVPASGAATRMFKTLFSFISDFKGTPSDYEALKSDQSQGSVFNFFKEIEHFAFFEDLKNAYHKLKGTTLEEAILRHEYGTVLEVLLYSDGLDYGSLPKGLLKFHSYGEEARTPVEEHMVEGAQYAKDGSGKVNIHFTVSPDHLEKFKSHVAEVSPKYEAEFDVSIEVSYSIQKPSTDTIAVDLENEPFRNDDGTILFRPAGHGALLENLNDINADIVFLKNIDNVVPDSMKEETIKFKKVIAGVLLSFQSRLKDCIQLLDNGEGVQEAVDLLQEMGLKAQPAIQQLDQTAQLVYLKSKLNRPLRICGMVQSEGDPGGGPFWVSAADGSSSLQVVETAQIDLKNPEQKKVFAQATHFNPVDVVCWLKDVNGNSFDLMNFRDPDTGFITHKSKDGKDLKAQELPGLWNGAMANWNTVFVSVPAVTFNPVKSVNDLLKKEHQ